ncbi:CBS domain-containing protein [Haliscomenobacter sp.]|uniref:CBS domain-containing protein n=1 Tax=Haliscomenobacter sp. TaxID=2717303 RepID=UPI0035935402
MIAETLISTAIIPLQTSDTGDVALEMMSEFYVRHLPIVNNRELLGVLSEDDVMNFDVNEAIGSYSLSLQRPYVHNDDHIYEVMRIVADQDLSIVPVVDAENNYLGVITLEDLLRYFARTVSFADSGSIIVLELSRRDYSMTEIARIVESEGATLLSSFITSYPESERIDVTLKVNLQHIHNILATFERFKYEIKASFNEAEYLDSLKERYQGLMSYLNV